MPIASKFLLAVVLLFSLYPIQAQQRTISGTVTDRRGFPLSGVNILVVGTSRGTQSDFDGKYSLEIRQSEIIEFSYLGFTSRSIPVGDQLVINVILQEEATLLDEVVLNVLAIGTRKAEDLTSSTNIDVKAVERSAETALIQGLAGKTSGVIITRNNGDPGTGAYIQIRGQNTILGDASPLIILDGIPISNRTLSGFSGGPSTSSRLNDIDESDIESITVLKGASAAALYGTGAANGVLVIRTKSGAGTAGDLRIDVQLRLGFDVVNRKFPKQEIYGQGDGGIWNANDILQWGDKISERPGGPDDILIGNERFEARDGTLYYPILNKNSRETFNGVNRDQVFQTGVTFDRSVALTYTGDHSNTYMSYNDWEQEGVIRGNSDYRRQNLRFKHTQQIRDAWEITLGVTYSRVKRSATNQGSDFKGLYVGYLRTPPDFDNSDHIGTYYNPEGVPSLNAHRAYRSYLGAFPPGFNNPGWTLYEQSYNEGTDRFILNPQIRWNISESLSLTGRYGIDYFMNSEEFFFPVNTAGFQQGLLSVYEDRSRIEDYNLFLNGKHNLKGFLGVDWVLGMNFNSVSINSRFLREQNFLNPFVGDLRAFGNAEIQNNRGIRFLQDTKKSGVYGLLNVSAWEALRLEASFRYERPSSLEKNIFYPSASLGWTLTETIGNLGFLNFAKVRLSYGEIGIEPPPYANNTVYGPGGTNSLNGGLYGGAFARNPQRGNPDLKEERIREFEAGMDLGLFENRLSLNVTYYNRLTSDALLSQPLPPSSGFTSELRNSAEISNKGIEIDARYNLFNLPDFQWSISGNFSLNRNIVEKLPGANSVVLGGLGPVSARAVEGEPFGVLWGPRPLRDEDGIVFDSNGFPLLDPESGIIGDPNPDWRGGLSTRISWKGITFTALLETFQGADLSGGTYNFLQIFGVPLETAAESVAPPGGFTNLQGVEYPEGTVFRGSIRDFGAGPVPLDIDWYTSQRILVQTIQDGSWTRIRELSLFYGFPVTFCERIGLRTIELGLTGRNLFLWTNFIGNDPDLNLLGASKARGIDFFTNPGTKGYMFTLKVGL